MALRLFCLHGHHLELTSREVPTCVICPVCGCVNEIGSADSAQISSGSRDLTQEMPEAANVSIHGPRGETSLDTPEKGKDETARNPPIVGSGSISPTLPSDQMIQLPTVEDAANGVASRPYSVGRGERPSRNAVAVAAGEKIGVLEELAPPKLNGYEVLSELGRGGMGVVYRAYDKQHGRYVALKTLQRMSPLELQGFKQEFRSLADVAHPNLASLYSLLSDGQTWCFTMELLESVDCLSYVWSGFNSSQQSTDATTDNRLSGGQIQRLKEVLKQLALGLHALHSSGMLHRDVKPSNVLVTADGCLKLVDFGLSTEIRQEDQSRHTRRIQGTPEYMSPEQAACSAITAASDWYAVGVILFELLTGQLPIQGSPVQILVRKQREASPEPREIEPSSPQDLNDLCTRLLDRNPLNRPTAADVLRSIGAADLADGLRDIRTGTARLSELVGRESQLGALRAFLAEVEAGNTLSVFVHGKSGMGKSVLVRRFLDEMKRSREAVILEGRCYEQESVPFKALDSLIDSLAVFLETLPPEVRDELRPRDSLPLTRLFPVLGQVLKADEKSATSIATADQQELRHRALEGLQELLTNLGEKQPLVLYVDDLQWGDVDSALLLADLVRPPHAPRLLLLGSYRSEEVATSACLQTLADAFNRGRERPRREELSVNSLSHEEAKQLAMMLLDRDGASTQKDDPAMSAYADRIARESGGWPFFVWELAQHVQDQSSGNEGSLDLDEVIWSRVCRLPSETRRLLELFAVAGRPMPAPQAYEAIERVSQGPSLLAQLRASNFVRITEFDQETLVEPYHDRIRESVVSHLPQSAVRDQNLMLALAIERSSGIQVAELQRHLRSTPDYAEPIEPCPFTKQQWRRVFDLAFFFASAGKIERAFPYALAAAEKAWSQNAFDVAEQQYQIAARGAVGSTDAIRFRVAEGLGEVLLTQGRYDDAARHLKDARSLVHGGTPAARVDGRLGFVAFQTGDMASAQEHFEKGLSELGNPTPRNNVTQMLALLKESIVQVLHTNLPSQFLARRAGDTEQCRFDLLRARLYDGLGYAYWFIRGPVPTLWTHLRHMNLAERYPKSKELGRAYAMHGIMMTAIPLSKRGAAYAEKSYHIHGAQGDLRGQGKARSFQTFSLLAMGHFQEGVQTGREAIRLLEKAGDVWDTNMARLITSQPLYFTGDLESSYREARRAYETGKETGDYSAMAIAVLFWPPSAPGTMPMEAIQAELERKRNDPLSESGAIQGCGIELLLHHDQPLEAASMIQNSLDLARRRGLRNPCIFFGVTWKATALRMAAEREPAGPSRRKALKAARQAVRDALKITRSYLAGRAQAWREHALVCLLEGQPSRARRAFDESLRIARQQEAAYEYAQTLVARGEAGMNYGWPAAAEQAAAGQAQLAAIKDFPR